MVEKRNVRVLAGRKTIRPPQRRLFDGCDLEEGVRIDLSGDPIRVDKEESTYDRFVAEFMECWPDDWKYVLVSGYAALVLGRERTTEDIDMLVAKPTEVQFGALWRRLHQAGFWCLQTSNPTAALNEYLLSKTALRFAHEGKVDPNFEVKIADPDTGAHSLRNRKQIVVNGRPLWFGPWELQIAFKLYLGTDKDFEDAIHLHRALKERLNQAELNGWLDKLGVGRQARRRTGIGA